MPLAMVLHRMALLRRLTHQLRITRRTLADAEESGFHLILPQDVQHRRGDGRVRPVINGDGHFATADGGSGSGSG
jgi:hypothetical protein